MSELDVQAERDRNYGKRSHDSYNDDYDRGKVSILFFTVLFNSQVLTK